MRIAAGCLLLALIASPILLALIASPILAQTAPPPDELTVSVGEDWQAIAIAQKHTVEDMRKLVQAYQALKSENEKLKAENEKLKAPSTGSPSTGSGQGQ